MQTACKTTNWLLSKEERIDYGFYSNLATYEDCCTHDASITPPEQQLLWRLDDLRDRLDELKISAAPYGGVCNYTKRDLRYAPTGYFSTIYDVEIAIGLAIEDLRNKYGIEVSKEAAVNDSFGLADNTIDQLSLFEIIYFHPCCKQLCAA